MENKVTSYELSKQLHELGFDCENYTGTYYLGMWRESDCLHGDTDRLDPIKAYDCDDLLDWLAYHQEMAACWEWKLIYRPYSISPADGHGVGFVGTVSSLKFGYTCQADQPVSVLAQIIIRILKEINNGN